MTLASSLAPRTFANSFVFPEKFLFYTDTPGSIEWLDPAPRLHIDDCFEIHSRHWGLCDLLLSSHQKFSAGGTASPVRLLQGALVILARLQTSQFGSFGKWILRRNTVLRSWHFYKTFRTRVVRSACGCWHFCIFEIFWEVLQPFRRILQAVSGCSLAPVSWCSLVTSWLAGFDELDESCGGDVEDEFDELDESCGGDVEDELVLELDESPGPQGNKVLRLA